MSLVFAAIAPHSPLLVPNIGKENLALFPKTVAAGASLAQDFKHVSPDAVIVITSHGHKRSSGFVFNLAETFAGDLSAFGDLVTAWEFTGSIDLPARFRERLENRASVQLTTDTNLDYGAAIPLFLAGVPASTPIFPISVSDAGMSDHVAFGKLLQQCILDERSRIAVIASADLSHRVSKKSPAGYSAKAKKLDQRILDSLGKDDVKDVLSLSPDLLRDTAIEDMGAIAMLFGILDGINHSTEVLSYEAPFGVGHAVIRYQLS